VIIVKIGKNNKIEKIKIESVDKLPPEYIPGLDTFLP